ncbi:hypothetical protein H072_7116 [Dactylellina haptotyla CBS 200.50]|uniref:Cyanovirin-N domain-containing protein n=1 Tax=Dactylellina haptotyla (strain CBS 200.50) TaxID=1284197 RepID=S8BUU7_DACHA|nr:hypothetical protein H072_7116 [Dactylellina haptotyla CBS 200.50]
MRLSALSLAAFYGSLAAAAGCNKDNCLRAVIASAFTTRDGVADCHAYLVTTVTPAVSVVTSTVTSGVSSVTESYNNLRRRRLRERAAVLAGRAAPTIPAYASACSGAVRYSSACSCVGVTSTVVMAPTPVITVTETASALPTLLATNYPGTSIVCAGEAVNSFPVLNGQCISNPTYWSINLGSFGPSSCDQSKCGVQIWGGGNLDCFGPPTDTLPASDFCMDCSDVWSFRLSCASDACG